MDSLNVLENCTACGPHGICVESPIPEYTDPLCVCKDGFSGAADYFDVRVIRNGAIELSLSCNVSDVGVQVVWSMFFVAIAMRLCVTLVSFVKFHSTKKIRTVTKRLMVVDILATLVAIAFVLQKLIDPAESVLGTSIPATLTQVLSILVMNAIWSYHQIEEFMMLSNIRTWRQLRDHKLGRLQLQLQVAFVFTYFVISVISIASLGISKWRIGPEDSGLLGILLARNMGIIIWCMLLLLGASKMQQREKSTRNLLIQYEGTERPARVIEYLRNNKKSLKRRFFLAAVLYIVFSLPPLWDQQYINIGLTSALLAFTTSIGYVLLRSERAAFRKTLRGFMGYKSTVDNLCGTDATSTVKSPAAQNQKGLLNRHEHEDQVKYQRTLLERIECWLRYHWSVIRLKRGGTTQQNFHSTNILNENPEPTNKGVVRSKTGRVREDVVELDNSSSSHDEGDDEIQTSPTAASFDYNQRPRQQPPILTNTNSTTTTTTTTNKTTTTQTGLGFGPGKNLLSSGVTMITTRTTAKPKPEPPRMAGRDAQEQQQMLYAQPRRPQHERVIAAYAMEESGAPSY